MAATTDVQSQAEKQAQDARREIDKTKREAAEALQEAGQKGQEAAEEVKQQAHQVAEDVKATAQEARDEAQRRTVKMVERQKAAAAGGIESFRDAIASASDKLREEDNHNVADYADSAVQQMSKAADYLKHRDLGQLAHDIERFARKRPEVFFGGLIVAGVAASRFLKASRSRRNDRPGTSTRSDGPQSFPAATGTASSVSTGQPAGTAVGSVYSTGRPAVAQPTQHHSKGVE